MSTHYTVCVSTHTHRHARTHIYIFILFYYSVCYKHKNTHTSVLVSEYSLTLSTATMLFSRSEDILTIQFRDMVTYKKPGMVYHYGFLWHCSCFATLSFAIIQKCLYAEIPVLKLNHSTVVEKAEHRWYHSRWMYLASSFLLNLLQRIRTFCKKTKKQKLRIWRFKEKIKIN